MAPGPRVRMGRRVLDLEKRILVDSTDGSEETLTASEFDLLKLFAENPNRPLQRDWLLKSAAHREMEAFDRAIDLRVARLRRKIEADPAHPDAIRTMRGVGYMSSRPKIEPQTVAYTSLRQDKRSEGGRGALKTALRYDIRHDAS